jgi:hypothetical protein
MGMDNGTPVFESVFSNVTFKTKFTIPAGHTVAPQALTETRNVGVGQTLLIVSARVLESADAKTK